MKVGQFLQSINTDPTKEANEWAALKEQARAISDFLEENAEFLLQSSNPERLSAYHALTKAYTEFTEEYETQHMCALVGVAPEKLREALASDPSLEERLRAAECYVTSRWNRHGYEHALSLKWWTEEGWIKRFDQESAEIKKCQAQMEKLCTQLAPQEPRQWSWCSLF